MLSTLVLMHPTRQRSPTSFSTSRRGWPARRRCRCASRRRRSPPCRRGVTDPNRRASTISVSERTPISRSPRAAPVEQVSGRSFPATPGFRSVSRSPSHCRPTQPPEREAIQQSSSTPGRLYRLSDCGTLAWCPVGTPDQRFSPASSASGWVVAPSTGHASMGTTHMISISMPSGIVTDRK